ncbi:hypothetical protein [Rhizobium sp. BK176]|uniref:hypothetical protein n=1 Tax=Rhizobium sp. BK176 TaxID=2587071 RepID=UPI002169DBEA|nr:hypothetical protein [Rhizobium sp. BK176]MCS4089220.1 hypothetical protein [Rhizobium sp. BK176]
MIVHDILVDRKKAVLDQIASLEQEIAEIDRMLALSPPPSAKGVPLSRMTKEEQILEAIKAGHHTPAQITDHLSKAIGKTINSGTIRTRLHRMKVEGKIIRDARGWNTTAAAERADPQQHD